MNSVSKRALAGLSFLALTAASCGSVESIGGSAVAEPGATTTAPDEVALEDTGDTTTTDTTTTDDGADLIAVDSTEPGDDTDETEIEIDDGAPTTEATTTTEPDDDETTTSTTAPPAALRTPDQRVLTTEDLIAVGLTVESSWSVPPEAASQALTCGVPAPGIDGRITQVFQTPSGTMVAQYVQEGATVADQWMTSLAALDGCVEAGVSPMRLGKGEAPSADQTLVLDANGSDDDGGYMAVVGGRKGDLVTGFMTVGTDPDDPALSSETLLLLLEVAIAD